MFCCFFFQGIQFLKSLTDSQMAHLVRNKTLADGSGVYGDLYVNDASIVDAMLQAGYCTVKPAMVKKGQPLKQGPQGPMGQGAPKGFVDPTVLGPGPQMMDSNVFSSERAGAIKGPGRDQRNTVSPLGNQLTLGQPWVTQTVVNQHQPNLGFPMKIG